MPAQTGLDTLRDNHYTALQGLRVGLMTNPSAVDTTLISAYDRFRHAPEVRLTALFGPEHGFAGAMPDGEKISSQVDVRTGLPVYSLYGDSLRPTADMLADMDVMVCDIQDIGVRYYTFTWTISYILEACGEHGLPVVILDRPNPLGGGVVDGPLLHPDWASIVGRFPVPVRHGLTLGEMAQMVNDLWNPTPAPLTVIACTGWQRNNTWEQTGLTWIPPSPNMPQLSTLHHYPGACLVEGTNLSEGRGTTLPFEIVGAPWVDGIRLAERLNERGWPGVRFRPHTFQPTVSKWAGQTCGGVQLHIVDRAAFQPISTWLGVMMTVRDLYPAEFAWLVAHFDRLIGSDAARLGIEAGQSLEALMGDWANSCETFAETRKPYLLYS